MNNGTNTPSALEGKEREGFDFQLGQLTEKFQTELSKAIGHYSVPLVVQLATDHKFVGSGTLISFKKRHRILTAEHVVNDPKDKKFSLIQDGPKQLVTSVAEFAHAISIDVQYLEIETTGIRENDYYGPDLAFIKIPDGPFLQQIKARKSFVNITVQPEERFANSCKQWGCMVVGGFPETDRVVEETKDRFRVSEGLKGYGFITGQKNYEEREYCDYLEVGVTYGGQDNVPPNFSGVSGGGLWRVPIYRKKGTSPGTEYFKEFFLAGVIFYEKFIDDTHHELRGHGPKSLYKWFFPQLLKRFT